MTETAIRIMPVTTSDDEALAVIIRSALKEFGANKPGTVYYDDSTDHLSTVFRADRSAYFVLHEHGTVAGGAGIYPTTGLAPDTCELVKMYLAPSSRKKGYASQLMKRCFEAAKHHGYAKMYIETMPELSDAIAFYQKYGFYFLKHPLGNSGHSGCDVWMMKKL